MEHRIEGNPMCNLYRTRRSAAEIAALFRAVPPAAEINIATEIYPGSAGMVVREQGIERLVEAMTWGFPMRLKGMKPTSKPKPVNNIADIRKPVWIGLARKPQWRCLIPATDFCEAQGEKGRKTRTWISVTGEPVFAWAGLWRHSDEWGAVYSGVMTNANDQMSAVHDRMPVLLHQADWATWLGGSFDECCALQDRVFDGQLLITPTDDLWSGTSRATEAPSAT